jgi:hypothetical protein
MTLIGCAADEDMQALSMLASYWFRDVRRLPEKFYPNV